MGAVTPALDTLRADVARAATRSAGDETPIVHTAAQLRAVVAEADALRDAVRAYLATLPESERNPRCQVWHADGSACSAEPAGVAPATGRPVCAVFAARYHTAPLPARVVTLRALAAMVRE